MPELQNCIIAGEKKTRIHARVIRGIQSVLVNEAEALTEIVYW